MLKGFVSGEEKDIKRIPMKGKNLFDDTTLENGIYLASSGNKYGNATNGVRSGVKIKALPNTAYTLSAQSSANVSLRILEWSNGTFTKQTPKYNISGSVSLTVTTDEKTTEIAFNIEGENGQYATNIMLNLGSTALPYEPYGYQEGWEVRDNQDRILWGREDELQTATGTLPFKGYALPVKVKSLLGNAVQNGTPSPQNIIMPEFVGVRTGNLWDLEQWLTSKSAVYTKNGDEYTIAATQELFSQPFYFATENVVVSLSGVIESVTANSPRLDILNADGTVAKSFAISTSTTKSENISCAGIRINWSAKGRFVLKKPMLNLGRTALPYEPFGWAEKITCAGQTTPIYLGEVPTVRRVKKLVLTGEENITSTHTDIGLFNIPVTDYLKTANTITNICSHYRAEINANGWSDVTDLTCRFYGNAGSPSKLLYIRDSSFSTVDDFKSYLAQQYAAGHPVTVWYVLANEQTGIVNEPLCKISTYADELTTIQVHGLSAPLYGIGDYKDTLNLSTGVITRKVKKYEFTGTEEWNKGNYPPSGGYQFFTPKPSGVIANPQSWIVTHFKMGSGLNGSAFASYLSLYPETSILPENATPNDFKAWLAAQYAAGTPVTIWYVLDTPETETVTVPTGMTGEIEGYLSQVSTPTPTNRSVPKWNGVEETGGTYAVTVYTPPEIPTTTGQNTLIVDSNLAPSKLEVSVHAKKIHYGFKIDKSNDDSESAVIYTHDAVTMTPAHMDFTNDRFDYGSWGNAFFVRDCYPVALNLDGTESYRLDPDDYTKKTDGTPSDIFYELLTEEPSDWSTQWKQYYTKSGDEYVLNSQSTAPTFTADTYYKLTYSSSFTGNFMMAFPKVWFYRHEDSQYNYIEISNHKLTDDWKCYAHINTSGQEVDFIYLPLFKGVIKDSKLRSLPGQIPQGGTTATTEVNAATALGSRWQIWDHSSVELINDLLTLMSKSIDSQGRFGKGRESGYNATDTVTYGKLQTGTLIKKGKFYGYSATTKEVKVFGLEGFWANRWDRLQGMLLVDNVWKIKMTPPYNFAGTDFVTLSNAEVPSGNGYLSKVQTSEYGSIPASADGDSSTKYFKDYFYKTATDTRVAIRGGACLAGALCGFRCVYVGNSASGSGWNIGASPVYK